MVDEIPQRLPNMLPPHSFPECQTSCACCPAMWNVSGSWYRYLDIFMADTAPYCTVPFQTIPYFGSNTCNTLRARNVGSCWLEIQPIHHPGLVVSRNPAGTLVGLEEPGGEHSPPQRAWSCLSSGPTRTFPPSTPAVGLWVSTHIHPPSRFKQHLSWRLQILTPACHTVGKIHTILSKAPQPHLNSLDPALEPP